MTVLSGALPINCMPVLLVNGESVGRFVVGKFKTEQVRRFAGGGDVKLVVGACEEDGSDGMGFVGEGVGPDEVWRSSQFQAGSER